MKNKLKIFFQLFPLILSMVILGAHFSRANQSLLMVLSLILPFILLIRHPYVARILQIVLLLGTFEWIRTAYVFASARAEADQPWLRLVIILGVMASLTLISAFVFSLNKIKELYGLKNPM